MLGRAKSCRWQVFVRRRPPKQGELRTDVSKATMFQGVGEALQPTIQSSAGSNFAEISSGFCRNRFCLQNAGVKALNRCERVAVLLTQDRCFSKIDYCTASSQQQAVFEKGCCTLALVRCEIEIIVC